MKRSPLKKNKALTCSCPLKVRKPLRSRKGLRQRSRKMSAVYEIRRELVGRILEEQPLCQRCLMARSVDVHEVVTRARGGSVLDEENCRAICRGCHRWIHDHPRRAEAEGWLGRRDA